jgi:hypothetical protein
MTPSPAAPNGRNFGLRAPGVTTLDWVTEVPDETAHDIQLSRTARAHLLANRAAMDLMADSESELTRVAQADANGRLSIRISRPRPLRIANPAP